MKNFLVSLPKPSNIVAREPISSIEGLRRNLKKGKFRYAYHSFEPASLYSEMVARRLLDLGSGLGIFHDWP
jgi:hypothetical protein